MAWSNTATLFLDSAESEATTSGRKRPDGQSTNEVIRSAHIGDNAPVFREILDLFVPKGSRIADTTWGKGAFWRQVADYEYEILPSDLQMGVDCRDLPYEDGSLDALVLDPPYMEGLYRRDEGHLAGSGSHSAFRKRYSDSKASETSEGSLKYHNAVLDLYLQAGNEAWRTLRNYGIFVVKCQDEVSANRQHLTHVELITAWEERFYCKDLFVVVRANRPGIVRMVKQEHARKNHSYFLVFVKRNPDFPKRIRPTRAEQIQINALLESRTPTAIPTISYDS